MKKPKGSIDTGAVKGATKLGVMITPEQIAASGTEHGHQAAFFQWIAISGREFLPYWKRVFAVPNGGGRTASVGAALAAEGVKKGVPDVCYPVPLWHYAGLWIEFKVPGLEQRSLGGRSEAQVEWAKDLRKCCYAVCTAYGWKAGVWAISEYHAGRLIMPDDGDALPVEAII